jgi:hypothetical protein
MSITDEIKSERDNIDIPESILRSIDTIIKRPQNLRRLFFSFIKKLNRFCPVSKAILIVHSDSDEHLKVIAIKGEKSAHEGLTLTLPSDNSLLYSIFRSRVTYTAGNPFVFSGNFFERKLLLDGETKSLFVAPILLNGTAHGLVCLSSSNDGAFAEIDQGCLEQIIGKFSKVFRRKAILPGI